MVLRRIAAGVLAAHGLIHLLGFTVYWKIAGIDGLPYPDRLLDDRLDAPTWLVRVLGLGWLAVALAIVAAALGWLFARAWWVPVLTVATLVSLGLGVLAWPGAQAGVAVNIVILLALALRRLHLVRWPLQRPHMMNS